MSTIPPPRQGNAYYIIMVGLRKSTNKIKCGAEFVRPERIALSSTVPKTVVLSVELRALNFSIISF